VYGYIGKQIECIRVRDGSETDDVIYYDDSSDMIDIDEGRLNFMFPGIHRRNLPISLALDSNSGFMAFYMKTREIMLRNINLRGGPRE
jgi:hypothetical protein